MQHVCEEQYAIPVEPYPPVQDEYGVPDLPNKQLHDPHQDHGLSNHITFNCFNQGKTAHMEKK